MMSLLICILYPLGAKRRKKKEKMTTTPKSSQELFESLRQLRSDPLVAAVLRGDGEQQGGSRFPNEAITHGGHREASPPTRSAFLASHPTHDDRTTHRSNKGIADEELQHVALAHESNQFLRNRDATRASVGVNHWVHNHRGEVDAAEARRVENRLKAEKMFAQTQLDVEKFRLEHQYRSLPDAPKAAPHQVPPGNAFESNAAPLANAYEFTDHEGGSSPVKQTQTTPPDIPLVGTEDQQSQYRPVAAHVHPYHPSTSGDRAPLSLFSPLHAEMERFYTTASPQLNTDDVYGPVDEDENYRVKALAAVTNNASSGNDDGAHYSHGEDLFQRNTEVAALREAVEQRDRTIKRLERQLAQDRDYYEQEIQRYKSDAHEERIANEGRVTALRAQIDQLVSSRAGRNAHETTIEDMTVKLQAVQRMYRESIDEIRRAAASRNELLEKTCEERIKVVAQRAEDAIRQAKEAYRVDRSEYLTSQKERLVELVQREQNLLLREAEASLKDVVEASVRDKLITEIELAFRKHLQADILPALRDQMRADATADVLKDATIAADGMFATKSLELRNLLQDHCAGMQSTMASRFQTTAEHILRSVHTKTDGVVASTFARNDGGEGHHSDAITISSTASVRLRQTHVALNDAIEKTVVEDDRQKKLDELHGEKMAVYRRRMDQIEGALESEKQFADAIRFQVAQTTVAAPPAANDDTATGSVRASAAAPPLSTLRRAVHVASAVDDAVAPPWINSLSA
jgi:hypothetical protein